MSELHVLGEILRATDFPTNSLYCEWQITCGSGWKELEGSFRGRTHLDTPTDSNTTIFAHPIDVHLAARDVQGWPRLRLKVYQQDLFGRTYLSGYGMIYIPSTPGHHEVTCVTWKPRGTIFQQIFEYFLGGSSELVSDDDISSGSRRYSMHTVSMGSIVISLNVIIRKPSNF